MPSELGAVPVVAEALDPDQVAEAVGSARPYVIVLIGGGLALAGVGLFVAGDLDADSEWTALLTGLLLWAWAAGSSIRPCPRRRSAVVPAARAATGAAINNTFRL
jgi:hypothetical protein